MDTGQVSVRDGGAGVVGAESEYRECWSASQWARLSENKIALARSVTLVTVLAPSVPRHRVTNTADIHVPLSVCDALYSVRIQTPGG